MRSPWVVGKAGNCNLVHYDHDDITGVASFVDDAAAKRAAMLSIANHIQQVRGWGVIKVSDGWQVCRMRANGVEGVCSMIVRDDPCRAIIDTEFWYQDTQGVDPTFFIPESDS